MSHLRISLRQGLRTVATAAHPFTACIVDGRIHLRAPSYSRIELGSGLRKTIFDGSHWKGDGVFVDASHISFTFPLWAQLRVQAQGKIWDIALDAEGSEQGLLTSSWDAKAARNYLFSAVLHALVFVCLLVAPRFVRFRSSGPTAEALAEAEKKKEAELTPGAAGGAGAASDPYEGVSYRRFLEMLVAKMPPTERVNGLLAKLKGLKTDATGAAGSASLQGAKGTGFGAAPTAKGAGVTSAVRGQTFGGDEKAVSSKALTDAQRNLLRKKFHECQDELKRVYARLLSQDPSMSVTVSMRAVVEGSGYLRLDKFDARGSAKAASVAKLKEEISRILRGVYVGPELAGAGLSGESVFVR